MTRVLSLLFLLALASTLYLLSDPPTDSLAALVAGTLLSEPGGG
jgi:hypothetical protein